MPKRATSAATHPMVEDSNVKAADARRKASADETQLAKWIRQAAPAPRRDHQSDCSSNTSGHKIPDRYSHISKTVQENDEDHHPPYREIRNECF